MHTNASHHTLQESDQKVFKEAGSSTASIIALVQPLAQAQGDSLETTDKLHTGGLLTFQQTECVFGYSARVGPPSEDALEVCVCV